MTHPLSQQQSQPDDCNSAATPCRMRAVNVFERLLLADYASDSHHLRILHKVET
ncbi:Uncharacterized protein YR821_1690 [Yersinia ruckeri]|nr:Uncharacterized protein YR821_1690 [Yersinia ruckeri]